MTNINKIPKSINPCPIFESIIEVRFETDILPDAIFGILYKEFNGEYPQTEKLPILQIPEQIRLKDPELIYKPYYKLISNNFILQIGPKVFSIINQKNYSGWDIFSNRIQNNLNIVKELNIVKTVKRLGIRYINFFEMDIFEKTTLNIRMNELPLNSCWNLIRSEIKKENFIHLLTISNNVELTINEKKTKGSVIDIDTSIEQDINVFSDIYVLIEKGHIEEKKEFFSLLKPDFIETLHPVY